MATRFNILASEDGKVVRSNSSDTFNIRNLTLVLGADTIDAYTLGNSVNFDAKIGSELSGSLGNKESVFLVGAAKEAISYNSKLEQWEIDFIPDTSTVASISSLLASNKFTILDDGTPTQALTWSDSKTSMYFSGGKDGSNFKFDPTVGSLTVSGTVYTNGFPAVELRVKNDTPQSGIVTVNDLYASNLTTTGSLLLTNPGDKGYLSFYSSDGKTNLFSVDSSGNVTVASGAYYYGDGSKLTGISAGSLQSAYDGGSTITIGNSPISINLDSKSKASIDVMDLQVTNVDFTGAFLGMSVGDTYFKNNIVGLSVSWGGKATVTADSKALSLTSNGAGTGIYASGWASNTISGGKLSLTNLDDKSEISGIGSANLSILTYQKFGGGNLTIAAGGILQLTSSSNRTVTYKGNYGETSQGGQVVSINPSTGTIYLAKASSSGYNVPIGVAPEYVGSSSDGGVCGMVGAPVTVYSDISGLTKMDPVYLSAATAGAVTGTAPSDTGDTVWRLGYVLSPGTGSADGVIIWMPQYITYIN